VIVSRLALAKPLTASGIQPGKRDTKKGDPVVAFFSAR